MTGRISPIRPENEESGTEPPEPINRSRYFLVSVLAIGLVVLAGGATYAAVANNWVPDLTGRFYSESEHDSAIEKASIDARAEGFTSGQTKGEAAGFVSGHEAGLDQGYRDGASDGYDQGYDDGFLNGSLEGWDDGYSDGYGDGWNDGCTFLFNGLGTDRVGDWWDYYYSVGYASYYNTSACN